MTPSIVGRITLLLGAFAASLMTCGVLMFALSGDPDPVTFLRNTYLRLQLLPYQNDLDEPISTDPTTLRFEVPAGFTARDVGAKLEAEGFILDGGIFADYAQLEGLDSELDAGTFFISRNLSTREIANALTDARFSEIQFTVLPGQRIEEVAASVDAFNAVNPIFTFTGADFLAFVGPNAPIPAEFAASMSIPAGMSLEGFLLPDTYFLEPNVTPEIMRDTMLAKFSESITPQMRQDALDQGYSIYDIVTIASIVEREAFFADEHATIASVYRNRLEIDDDIPTLDADPTVQYGHPFAGPGNWWPRITRADYRGVNSVYNTYINQGLPPGPISNPSFNAIEKTIYAAETPFLFFRADCRRDNRHDFFTNYNDHRTAC